MNDGKHLGGFKYRNRRKFSSCEKHSFLGFIVTAIAGSVLKDLTSGNSRLITFIKKILPPARIEGKQEQKSVIDADYSVIKNKSPEKKPKKLEHN